MVASGPRRRLGVTVTDKHGKPVPGSADAPAGFSAFSGGFTNNTDDAVPEELIQKVGCFGAVSLQILWLSILCCADPCRHGEAGVLQAPIEDHEGS